VQGSSAGQANVVTRVGPGQYEVRFTGLAAGGGTAQATPVGANVLCNVAPWAPAGADLVVPVLCSNLAGAPADSAFTLSVTKPARASSGRFAYVLDDRPGNATYTPRLAVQFNSSGKRNRIQRVSPGVYRVTLPGLAGTTGTVKVVAFGASFAVCQALTVASHARDRVVDVACSVPGHLVSDAAFLLSFADRTSILGVAHAPAADLMVDGTGAATGSYNSTGLANTVTRDSTGVYTVHLPGVGRSAGLLHVAGVGGAANCVLSSFDVSFGAVNAHVVCAEVDGQPQDAAFALQFTR
jgi:hypothetical protein